ncbi:MAG: response regulator transcription factor [Nitrospirota bacterium]
MALRLFIGCSNTIFGEGLKKLLEDERDIEIIGVFPVSPDTRKDTDWLSQMKPDVILADYNSDLDVLWNLPDDYTTLSRLKILLIGDRMIRHMTNKHLKDLILRGVVGILPPSADSVLLKKALKAVKSGELWLDRNALMKIINSMRNQEKKTTLAKREKEIVLLVCQGYRNKEIAQKLHISEQTVKSHCNRIYKKIGVSDRLQLALYSHKISEYNTKV